MIDPTRKFPCQQLYQVKFESLPKLTRMQRHFVIDLMPSLNKLSETMLFLSTLFKSYQLLTN